MIIGLTGPIAAGKNEAAHILQEEGCAVIDADIVAHQALNNAKTLVLERFLTTAQKMHIELVNPDSTINRRNLGKIVFSDKESLRDLENILYPLVTQSINKFIEQNSTKTVVLNAIALQKTPLIERCNFLIYVDAPFFTRFFRVLKRDKLPPIQIIKRFFAQKKLYAQYLAKTADIYKVKNNKKTADLKKQLMHILQSRRT